jgi:hypothetical protein
MTHTFMKEKKELSQVIGEYENSTIEMLSQE